jgi:fatty acid desaturase
MSLDVLRDRRLRTVAWRDLLPLRAPEVVAELLLPLPWLALSLALAHYRLYAPALAASFVFFLTGLRVVHNAYHYALGLPRALTEAVMAVLSVLMLGSMHAVQFNHLRHHRHCLGDDDVEGMCARMPAWRALLVGPWFPLRMHLCALGHGGRRVHAWVGLELVANVLWVGLVYGVWQVPALRYHVLAMAAGQCLTGFFAVWTVHRGCDRSVHIARTLRGRFKNALSFSMFYHVEHHLFPRVPTRRLCLLARRLDAAVPELREKQVF